ncbi:MAG: hypothetical protein ACKO5Q_14510 [Microcystaceae cyanobacterium]
MKESAIYQEILHEGELKGRLAGKAEGKAEGQIEATCQIARNMLNSGLALDLISQLTGLSLTEIQELQ